MKKNIKEWLMPILFAAGGTMSGLACYYFVGCLSSACPLSSHPFSRCMCREFKD
ncbi:MAG: hypothetical protein LUE24_06125 [Lachnospiraceae bacterium]|nr:hypothetical protein [Lachnospiraceae bacterium]